MKSWFTCSEQHIVILGELTYLFLHSRLLATTFILLFFFGWEVGQNLMATTSDTPPPNKKKGKRGIKERI